MAKNPSAGHTRRADYGEIHNGKSAGIVMNGMNLPPIKETMKRYGNFWETIISRENLIRAYKAACKSQHKKSRATRTAIERTGEHLDDCVRYLQYILIQRTWRPSPYKERVIYEPKQRTIYIAKFFPDRILHHAIIDVLSPMWDKVMIYDTYSCRKGKGQHAGSRRCMEFIRRYPYCLKCDISKFYPSLDHDLLKTIIRRKLKDKEALRLLDLIIDSFPGRKNAPIGNLSSQWLGNLYLGEMDFFIKQELGVNGYLRYCDDFVLFGNSKRELNLWGARVRDFVENRLLLSFSRFDLFPVTRGIDFLGYRHFPFGYVLVRKRTARRMKKRVKELPHLIRRGIVKPDRAISTISSIEGWIKHANTYNFKESLRLQSLREEIENGKILCIRG